MERAAPDSAVVTAAAAAFFKRRTDLIPLGVLAHAPEPIYWLAGREP